MAEQELVILYIILTASVCMLLNAALISIIRNRQESVREEGQAAAFFKTNTSVSAKRTYPKKRRWWVAPGRTDHWWVNMWSGLALPEEWNKNFRMPREQFVNLADHLRPYISPDPTAPRMGLSVEKKVALTLHYLKDTGSIAVTANAFGVSGPTVSSTVRTVCEAINTSLGPLYLKIPTGDELRSTVANFEGRFGFPQVLGVVDGTHIPIERPTEDCQSYFSYKMRYTLNVQAVCDSNGRFIDVEICWPGGTHDAKVFANSKVNKAMREGTIPKKYRTLLPGRDKVPLLLLGDPAYPLLPHCMKEYSSCYSNKQVMFNTMLRSGRNQIECAFGRLKARWQILTRPFNFKLEDSPIIIYACFVLHNYCEVNNVGVDEEATLRCIQLDNENQGQNAAVRRYSTSTTQGNRIRDVLTDYFNEYMDTS